MVSDRSATGIASTRATPPGSRCRTLMPTSLRYRAILFDLFDTLVRFDRERLPMLELGGRAVRATVGHLHEVLRGWAPQITLEALHAGMGESWREAERLRAIDHREVGALERFTHLFR